MSETWISKIEYAIEQCKTYEDIEYVRDKILTSPQRPNYKTNEGRKLRDELLWKANLKLKDLIDNGLQPF